jgi:hypothetical protein
MASKADRFKPAVKKQYLLLLSGLMWLGVGIMLSVFSYHWLTVYGNNKSYIFAGVGFICALIIHHFGFLRIVDKNLGRISRMEGKRCVFSFMSWKSYIMVLVMVTMGILLRHSALPKQYLSVIYTGIGVALILSSIRYFRNVIIQMRIDMRSTG